MEMENLRSQHPSAFKERPENKAGSIRDFTGTAGSPGKYTSPMAKKPPTATPQTKRLDGNLGADLY